MKLLLVLSALCLLISAQANAQFYMLAVNTASTSKTYQIQDIEDITFANIDATNPKAFRIGFKDGSAEGMYLNTIEKVTFSKSAEGVDGSYYMKMQLAEGKNKQYNLDSIVKISFGTSTGVTELEPITVAKEVYPNPFTNSTTVEFALPSQQPVTVRIMDSEGKTVRTLLKATLPAGTHQAEWRGDNEAGQQVVAGMYFYQVTAGNSVLTRTMVRIH